MVGRSNPKATVGQHVLVTLGTYAVEEAGLPTIPGLLPTLYINGTIRRVPLPATTSYS